MAGAVVLEVEFLEQLDRGQRANARAEGDFQIAMFLTERQRDIEQFGADAPPLAVDTHAQAADFTDVSVKLLDTDHPNDFVMIIHSDPETPTVGAAVGTFDIVDIQPQVVVRQPCPTDKPLLIQRPTGHRVRRFVRANSDRDVCRFVGHDNQCNRDDD